MVDHLFPLCAPTSKKVAAPLPRWPTYRAPRFFSSFFGAGNIFYVEAEKGDIFFYYGAERGNIFLLWSREDHHCTSQNTVMFNMTKVPQLLRHHVIYKRPVQLFESKQLKRCIEV